MLISYSKFLFYFSFTVEGCFLDDIHLLKPNLRTSGECVQAGAANRATLFSEGTGYWLEFALLFFSHSSALKFFFNFMTVFTR